MTPPASQIKVVVCWLYD